MNISIISSSKDPAGINIRNNLIGLFGFEETDEKFENNLVYEYSKIKNKIIRLYLTNQDLIFAEHIDKKINADVFIFASKHKSRENRQSFSVHPIGNWGKADFGGQDSKLCFSSAILLKNLFIELNKNAENSSYEITLESTHHGPYVDKPAAFVEIGSTEKEWNDKENGEIIAKTIMNALTNEKDNYRIAVGIGGLHYCSNFNKIALSTDIAISHICPKYHLDKLDEALIKQSIEKTAEKVDFAILDWRGLGIYKQEIITLLEKLNIKYERVQNVLKSN